MEALPSKTAKCPGVELLHGLSNQQRDFIPPPVITETTRNAGEDVWREEPSCSRWECAAPVEQYGTPPPDTDISSTIGASYTAPGHISQRYTHIQVYCCANSRSSHRLLSALPSLSGPSFSSPIPSHPTPHSNHPSTPLSSETVLAKHQIHCPVPRINFRFHKQCNTEKHLPT